MSAKIPFSPGDRVVAYVRYSGGEEQGLKDRSAKEQLAEIIKFCDSHSLTLAEAFEDAGISGTSLKGRDAFFRMIEYLKRKPKPNVQGVVVWSLSRFARDLNTAQLYKAELRHNGYSIYSLTEQFEDNATGILFETLIDWKNQMYSEEIGAHVSRALRSNFEQFRTIPGTPPVGYVRIPVELPPKKDGTPRIGYRYEPDPVLVPAIRMAFEMKASGVNNRQILIKLPVLGYKSTTSLNDMFDRTIYYGAYTYGGATMENYTTPIVSRELWEKAHAVHAANKGNFTLKGIYMEKSVGILSGILKCADCGSPMSVDKREAKGREYRSYRCNRCKGKTIRCEKIEEAVIAKIKNEILTDPSISAMLAAAQSRVEPGTDEGPTKDLYLEQIESIDAKIDRVTSAIAEIGLNDSIRRKLDELQTQRAEITSKLILETRPPRSDDEVEKDARNLSDEILTVLNDPESSPAAKRELLKLFIVEIVPTDKTTAVIRYHLPQSCGFTQAPPEGLEPPTF